MDCAALRRSAIIPSRGRLAAARRRQATRFGNGELREADFARLSQGIPNDRVALAGHSVGRTTAAWIFVVSPPRERPIALSSPSFFGRRHYADVRANAVYHATGQRIRDLPIKLDKLLV
jgi:hypothetical protein